MKTKKYTIGLFLLYLVALTWVIIFKIRFPLALLHTDRSLNLVPFGASGNDLEIIINVLIFLPYGIFVCMLGSRESFFNMLAPIFFTSLFYETIQYMWALGASDITDLITNTLGGIIGIGIFFVLHKIFKDSVFNTINGMTVLFLLFIAIVIYANMKFKFFIFRF
ncbi:VanZ family protein [Neobacillus sp. MM2021_6]|uniref:VanZ family protein n=1 Tax=Bacillaceae TaxID=186817 RepID=UPI00140A5708|nr:MULTISPECIES: VanZ family protein [Bacillaceae]MBO0959681.1 VanZ family protein [Neobacillus sp. MM2021_6]NHC19791.1 VanZ family protein [Bacillus sp. MM2020_4]